MSKYPEYKSLDLTNIAEEILQKWDQENTFENSVSSREGKKPYVFFEGPPSANGMPGIHHVMARSIKDIFCRYKTLKGFQVKRKAGWDTHGLPIELGVEKELGITKEDIGKKISIEDYNAACRKAVMKYTDVWNDLTRKMGYWVDMEHPYVTYENKYIESVWWLLKNIYDKNLLYKGYSIQPYSPAAGTGLSSAEINLPGCYKNVKDRSAVAMFKVKESSKLKVQSLVGNELNSPLYFLAWTTTPWTLPSNTALAVGKNIDYVSVLTQNPFTKLPSYCIVAKDLFDKHFSKELVYVDLKEKHEDYFKNEKDVNKAFYYALENNLLTKKGNPSGFAIKTFKGSDLIGLRYEQLLPYALPNENVENAFQVIAGDFVTTEDGTGIVHIAPTFGADDMRAAKESNVPAMLVMDENGKAVPLVDLRGKFRPEMKDAIFGFAGEYVKDAYLNDAEKTEELVKQKEYMKGIIADTSKLQYLSVDERIVLKLQNEGKLFKKEQYEHNYPHCWRTDKPILYYPLDSWFIKIPQVKERMSELNKTINWKPESTGTGRFGEWLKNANDWNLSRSRYWGIPLPIWRSESGEEKCIGSMEDLKMECEKAVKAGFMKVSPLEKFKTGDFSEENYHSFDLHRPYADDIILVSESGKPMKRELDLIDVWFDSGSMPYAQWHYPFENKNLIDNKESFPADFIAEGVDQTRGWFYTLHAIATMCFDSVAYKNVVSNGLVLDKNGVKMSKSKGNAVDPFSTLEKYGADATRWYMITNASPWDNLKFDFDGITETQRKFFRATYNSYAFFSLYANLDNFQYSEKEVPLENRTEIDRWILSKLNSLIKTVDSNYADYEPTKAGREIEEFVLNHLSNWYVRLCRRRFWKGEYSEDKIAAYQTLYTCLETISILSAPIAPFFSDKLFRDLNSVSKKHAVTSVHLADFPVVNEKIIDSYLEEKMMLAQKISSMVLSIRKNKNLKVRQPLQKIMLPVLNEKFREQVMAVSELILSEVNVKEILFLEEDSDILVKSCKANFKSLGEKYKLLMKPLAYIIKELNKEQIRTLESTDKLELIVEGQPVVLTLNDVEIIPQDVPGWLVANEGGLTVALDITLNKALIEEGIAREMVNRIQTIRKDSGLDLTDKIDVKIKQHDGINDAIKNNLVYICSETLATSLELVDSVKDSATEVEVDDEIKTYISITKI
jgi:isoleucyl-tRNA synthetase